MLLRRTLILGLQALVVCSWLNFRNSRTSPILFLLLMLLWRSLPTDCQFRAIVDAMLVGRPKTHSAFYLIDVLIVVFQISEFSPPLLIAS